MTSDPQIGVRADDAPTCYLCRSGGHLLYEGLHDQLFGVAGTWSLLRCPSCGLIWLNPRPIRQEIWKLYSSYFTHSAEDRPGATTSTPSTQLKRWILATACAYRDLATNVWSRSVGRMLSLLGPVRDAAAGSVMWLGGSQRGRLLDVGSGTGRFLAAMRDLGWDVVGVEPDPIAAQLARKFELEVQSSTLEEARLPNDSFDAVTMNHVIEHVPDPIGTLTECKRVLRPGGLLVVVTPNGDGLGRRRFGPSWRGWEVPRHLFVFTPRTLRACATRAGLRIELLRTSAKAGRFIWQASQLLRRRGLLPGGRPNSVHWTFKVQSVAFWLAEHLLLGIRPVGEEIVLIARKHDDRTT